MLQIAELSRTKEVLKEKDIKYLDAIEVLEYIKGL